MSVKTPHVHAAVIKAWADGANIEFFQNNAWHEIECPSWKPSYTYRVKPEPKPDVVEYGYLYECGSKHYFNAVATLNGEKPPVGKLKLIFDGETKQLKSAEVIND